AFTDEDNFGIRRRIKPGSAAEHILELRYVHVDTSCLDLDLDRARWGRRRLIVHRPLETVEAAMRSREADVANREIEMRMILVDLVETGRHVGESLTLRIGKRSGSRT